ncbi:MAG: 50S ribosomal protein L2 [Candidatus Woesearchaeota archaeon]|nr:50S ribosomal protein L2 [Candidatus Woesearchaeota archaeon]
MGKNLIQQRRGKGSSTFTNLGHKSKGSIKHRRVDKEVINGKIIDIVHCPGHSSPLLQIKYEDNLKEFMLAPSGVKVGDVIEIGKAAKPKKGNTVPLKNIPEGTRIYNIESRPGDGGKFVRSTGATAKIVLKSKDKIVVQLPSKKQKSFNPNCLASIGVVAGGGRTEKPFYKAGKKYHANKAKGKYWPKVSGQAMNAISHPFGGSRSSRKGRPTIAPKHAPPGRKVGMIRPKRTGRKKGRKKR